MIQKRMFYRFQACKSEEGDAHFHPKDVYLHLSPPTSIVQKNYMNGQAILL